MDAIDKILDENNTDNIILYGKNDEAVEFEQIALIPHEGHLYVILRPIITMPGMAEDEALVFRVEVIDGEKAVTIVEEDEVVDAVFDEYYRMLEEYDPEE